MKRIINKLKYERQKLIISLNNIVFKLWKQPQIKDIPTTIQAILDNKASLSRFGDGEFDIIFGRGQPFQNYNKNLKKRLKQILKSNNKSKSLLIAIPDCFGDLSHFVPEAQMHWRIRLEKERYKWYYILNRKSHYYHAQISRFYLDWADKSKSPIWFNHLTMIWKNRSVLIVEGEKSRLGLNNDLFDNTISVKRILCPAVNAFDKYEDILSLVSTHAKLDDLILIALGPTASVLSYDLHRLGFQAIDIGHIDIEYEWMKMKATKKERIPGRFMNEIDGGKFIDDTVLDEKYKTQIITVV